MNLSDKQLFHIYNQGNNGAQIFHNDEHYEIFLLKMRAFLLPFGSLISYCLMSNHFHWLFFVEKVEISKIKFYQHFNKIESQRRKVKYGSNAIPVKVRRFKEEDTISLNSAIGLLLRSYTRLLNNELGKTGSLFRPHCKSKDGWIDEFATVSHRNAFYPGNDYAFKCMTYIHNNPVSAGFVAKSVDWKFSSARDYAGIRNGSLINLEFGKSVISNM